MNQSTGGFVYLINGEFAIPVNDSMMWKNKTEKEKKMEKHQHTRSKPFQDPLLQKSQKRPFPHETSEHNLLIDAFHHGESPLKTHSKV